MLKQNKMKVLSVLATIFVFGALWCGVNYFSTLKTSEQFPLTQALTKNTGAVLFKSNFFDISFVHPSSFSISESKESIIISPLSSGDPQMQSSIGVASNLVITFRKNEQLLSSAVRTQHGLTDFYEEETTYKGFPALIQSYTGDYAGEKNYVILIQCNTSRIGNGVLYIHYTEVNKNTYENILNSLKFASPQ